MKNPIVCLTILLSAVLGLNFDFEVYAQARRTEPNITVTATGYGATLEDSRTDALRNAVEQACGVALKSESRMENYALVEDAVSTRASGYIASFKVLRSGTSSLEPFETEVEAQVNTSVLRADFRLLAQQVGGVRFLVTHNPKGDTPEEKTAADFAVERVNQALAKKNYRYIEKRRADELAREAMGLLEESSESEVTYAQQLGVKSGAQFLIVIGDIRIEQRESGFVNQERRVTIEAKSYDNCTGEGLGNVVLTGDWARSNNPENALREAITSAVNKSVDELLLTFNTYIGDWINNGTPFELRFYNAGTFRDLRDLRTQMLNSRRFGGEIEVSGATGFMRINCTYKARPDDMADRILDLSDNVSALRAKRMDVKLIFGRQISFAPSNSVLPQELREAIEANPEGAPINNATKAVRPAQTRKPAVNTRKANTTRKSTKR